MGRGHQESEEFAIPRPRAADAESRFPDNPGYGGTCSVADTAYRSIWNFPSLYFHRNQILEECLLHYGRGDNWENGEIVNIFGIYDWEGTDGTPTDLYPRDFIKPHPWSGEEGAAAETVAESLVRLEQERAEEQRWVRDNIDILSKIRLPIEATHGGSQYSPLANIPDDITPDWAQAAHELIELTLAVDPATAIIGDPAFDQYRYESVLKNKALAEAARTRLVDLGFPVPEIPAEVWTAEKLLPLVQKVYAEGHEHQWCCLRHAFAGDARPDADTLAASAAEAETMRHPFCSQVISLLGQLSEDELRDLAANEQTTAYGPFVEPYVHRLSYDRRHPLSEEQKTAMRELAEELLGDLRGTPRPPSS